MRRSYSLGLLVPALLRIGLFLDDLASEVSQEVIHDFHRFDPCQFEKLPLDGIPRP